MKMRFHFNGQFAIAVLFPCLLIILGSVSLCLRGFDELADAVRNQSRVAHLIVLSEYSTQLSRELALSQMAAIYPGDETRRQLAAQRQATDQALADPDDYFQRIGAPALTRDSPFIDSVGLRGAGTFKLALAAARRQVDRGGSNLDATENYASLMHVFAGMIDFASNEITTSDQTLSRDVMTYGYFTSGLYEAGAERTKVMDNLLKPIFSVADIMEATENAGQARMFFSDPLEFGTPAEVQRVLAETKWPEVADRAKLFKRLVDGVGRRTDVTPAQWFDATTRLLDRRIADHRWLAMTLRTTAEQSARNALTRLVITLAALISSTFAAVAVGVWFADLARRPIRRMMRDMGRLRPSSNKAG